MQIATYNGLTLLIQLNQVKALPNSLLNCLKDENIIKVLEKYINSYKLVTPYLQISYDFTTFYETVNLEH